MCVCVGGRRLKKRGSSHLGNEIKPLRDIDGKLGNAKLSGS